MRAVVVDPRTNSLELVELDDPTPGPGQLLVAVRAAGLNRADLAVRTGRYVVGTGRSPSAPAGPVVAGGELAGEVVAVGAGVEGWAVGDHVMAQGRGYAELAVVDAALALRRPPVLTWAEAGALPVAVLTMHDALVTNGRWRSGETVVVHAATSGVGVIGVQLALHLGAPLVVGTSRSPAKWPTLADAVGNPDRLVLLEPHELAERAAALTEDRGIDVIVDNVGAAVLGPSLAASAVLGRIVQVGRLGGRHGELDLDELARKRVSLIGVTFRTRTGAERRAVVDAVRRELGDALDAGVFRPVVHATYPLGEAGAAQDALARDEHVGKLVLVP
jgi:NADPH:quinone reductase-like Zn-dependent oxidoreductase